MNPPASKPTPGRTASAALQRSLRDERALAILLRRLVAEEQGHIIRREAKLLMACLAKIDDGVSQIRDTRAGRVGEEKAMLRQLARRGREPSLQDGIRQLPAAERTALVQLYREVADNATAARRLLRQNHLLLTHSIELLREWIEQLDSGVDSIAAYNARGEITRLTARRAGRLRDLA